MTSPIPLQKYFARVEYYAYTVQRYSLIDFPIGTFIHMKQLKLEKRKSMYIKFRLHRNLVKLAFTLWF